MYQIWGFFKNNYTQSSFQLSPYFSTMAIFHWSEYQLQQIKILEDFFQHHHGWIVVDWSFLHDEFLAEIIEWYESKSQNIILKNLYSTIPYEIYYSINAKHLVWDKQFSQTPLPFEKYCLKELAFINASLGIKPCVIITMPEKWFIPPHVTSFLSLLEGLNYKAYHHYGDDAFIIKDQNYILSSYETDNIPQNLIINNSIQTQRSSLPLSQEYVSNSITLLAQVLHYQNTTNNLSILDKFLEEKDSSKLQKNIKNYLSQYLKLLERLYQLWQIEEEDLEEVNEALQQL